MDWQTVLLRDSLEEALKEVTSMGLDMPSNQSGPVGLAFNRAGNLLLATSEVSGPLIFGFDGCTAVRAVAQTRTSSMPPVKPLLDSPHPPIQARLSAGKSAKLEAFGTVPASTPLK